MATRVPAKDDAEAAAEVRRKAQEREDPSGHGMQVKPAQQRAVAKSKEHAGDAERPVATVDPKTLRELKD